MRSETQPLLDSKAKEQQHSSSIRCSIWLKNGLCVLFTIFAVLVLLYYGFPHFVSKNITHSSSRHKNIAQLNSFNIESIKSVDYLFDSDWSWEELEKNIVAPKTWKWKESAPTTETITLFFAIKQRNFKQLEDIIIEISNPSSKKYGQWLTKEEVHRIVAPSEESIATVVSWILNSLEGEILITDIVQVTPNGDFLKVTVTIDQANRLLNTEYGYWELENRKQLHVKNRYYVPDYVVKHLDFITPTYRFPPLREPAKLAEINKFTNNGKLSANSDGTVRYVTPQLLYKLYSFPENIFDSVGFETNGQCIASFIGEYYTDSDVQIFWEQFALTAETELVRVPEAQPQGYGAEATLDVEYITTTGNQVNTFVWYIGDDGYFISLVEQLIASDHYPYVVSMSYGGDEQENGEEYCTRGNIEFAKGTAIGITFFASAGDNGATGEDGGCLDGSYIPSFPATSQYVTAVGGTYGGKVTGNVNTNTEEIAWFNSGGGFSTFFNRLSFQDQAVEDYFDTCSVVPPSSRYNREGRAYPDISAQSTLYEIGYEGAFYLVSGTSCSCPTTAGIFALINDLRLQAGKSVLGFLNPALYQMYDNDAQNLYFNDVVTGDNEGCDEDGGIAFRAASGWDPVTGLGTPKVSRLIEYFLSLP